jgi:hypothetical protein
MIDVPLSNSRVAAPTAAAVNNSSGFLLARAEAQIRDHARRDLADMPANRMRQVHLIDYSVEAGWGEWVRSFLATPTAAPST